MRKEIFVLIFFILVISSFQENVLAQVCNDSDDGLNYEIKGQTKLLIEGDENASCVVDVCMGQILSEGYCTDDGEMKWQDHNCTEDNMSCIDGRCVDLSLLLCIDTDGGLNYAKSGSAHTMNYEISDYCIDNMLFEAFCTNTGAAEWQKHECFLHCSNGACTNETVLSNISVVRTIYREAIDISPLKSDGKHIETGTGVTIFIDPFIDAEEPTIISFELLNSLPLNIPYSDKQGGEPYMIINLTLPAEAKANIESANVTIPLLKSWLERTGLEKRDIVVIGFNANTGAWEFIPIKIDSEDDANVYYSANEDMFLFDIIWVGPSKKSSENQEDMLQWVIIIMVLMLMWLIASILLIKSRKGKTGSKAQKV